MSAPATTTPKPAPGDDPLRAFRDEFVFPTFRQMKATAVSAEIGALLGTSFARSLPANPSLCHHACSIGRGALYCSGPAVHVSVRELAGAAAEAREEARRGGAGGMGIEVRIPSHDTVHSMIRMLRDRVVHRTSCIVRIEL